MGDTTDINAGDIKAAEGAAPVEGGGNTAARRGWWGRSWFGRHWRGELPLAKAFWINGILLNLAPEALLWGATSLMAHGSNEVPAAMALMFFGFGSLMGEPMWLFWPLDTLGLPPGLPKVTLFLAIRSALATWQIVGIWRSAGRYPGRPLPDGRRVGRLFWLITVRALMVVWVFHMLYMYWIMSA